MAEISSSVNFGLANIASTISSVGFVKRHLVVDGFSFSGVCVPGRKILHISLHDGISEFLVLIKNNKSCKAREVTNLLGISEPQQIWSEAQKFLKVRSFKQTLESSRALFSKW